MKKEYAKKDILISLVLFVVGVIFSLLSGTGDNVQSIICIGIIIGGVRYSWQFLNFITPNIFLIMPLIGWVIYFGVKFLLTLIIAPFAFIVKTISNIITIICN